MRERVTNQANTDSIAAEGRALTTLSAFDGAIASCNVSLTFLAVFFVIYSYFVVELHTHI